MSLIVEDGTIVAGAESLCSVAAADLYHSNFGNVAWAALSTSAKEVALRQATAYMGQAYRLRWKGARVSTVQVQDWPRFGVELDDVGYIPYFAYVASNIVPTDVQAACASLALTSVSGALAPDVERMVKEKVTGPLTTIYADGAAPHTQYRSIDMMLRAYLDGSGASGRMVRS